jgi:hypothetical protein
MPFLNVYSQVNGKVRGFVFEKEDGSFSESNKMAEELMIDADYIPTMDIKISAGRMSELIKSILNYSKLVNNENGCATVDLNVIVHHVRVDFELMLEEKQGRKPTVKEIVLISRETRPAALEEITTSEVVAFQRSQLSPVEWKQLQGLRSQAEAQTMPIQVGQEHKALRASISHLFERSSVLREHEILAEALNQSLGSLDLERLKQAASNGESGLVRLTDSPEDRLLSFAARTAGSEVR